MSTEQFVESQVTPSDQAPSERSERQMCARKFLFFPHQSFQGLDFWRPSSRLTEPDISKGL